ncbi:MAG: hypothetical protein ITG00_03385 [Flavobacterium sp.]|nr:hypothetical protein [Flavobacterium sp.]
MKKTIFCWFAFLLILLWMTSCRSKKAVVITETKTEFITETLRDTVFQIEKDSSHYRALLECINGKVVIKESTAQSGKFLKAPKAAIVNNELTVDCESELQELRAQLKDKTITRESSKEVPVFIENDLTFWEEFQIWAGRILLALLIILVIRWAIKKQLSAYGL